MAIPAGIPLAPTLGESAHRVTPGTSRKEIVMLKQLITALGILSALTAGAQDQPPRQVTEVLEVEHRQDQKIDAELKVAQIKALKAKIETRQAALKAADSRIVAAAAKKDDQLAAQLIATKEAVKADLEDLESQLKPLQDPKAEHQTVQQQVQAKLDQQDAQGALRALRGTWKTPKGEHRFLFSGGPALQGDGELKGRAQFKDGQLFVQFGDGPVSKAGDFKIDGDHILWCGWSFDRH